MSEKENKLVAIGGEECKRISWYQDLDSSSKWAMSRFGIYEGDLGSEERDKDDKMDKK